MRHKQMMFVCWEAYERRRSNRCKCGAITLGNTHCRICGERMPSNLVATGKRYDTGSITIDGKTFYATQHNADALKHFLGVAKLKPCYQRRSRRRS